MRLIDGVSSVRFAPLAVVEEIKISGHNRYTTLDRFKSPITDAVVHINEKNRQMYICPNTQSYMLTTNHKDALPVDDNDRRYFIVMSPMQTREQVEALGGPDYFDPLFAAINNHAGALRGWLLEYPLHPEFDAKSRAPDSKGRDRMRYNTRSDEDDLLRQLIDKTTSTASRPTSWLSRPSAPS